MSASKCVLKFIIIVTFNTLVSLNSILDTVILFSNSNNFTAHANLAYGQPDHTNLNVTNPLNIQSIPLNKVSVGDIDIAYKTFGNGDPILLISGSGLAMDQWQSSILTDLSRNHTVVIFDNRGVGNTTVGTKPLSIQQFANDTAGLIDALKLQKVNILSFSMGSFIAQELTIVHPEKVNRLILYGGSCGGKENVPQTPQVVKILSDIHNHF